MMRLLSHMALCLVFSGLLATEASSQRLDRCYETALLLGDSNVYGALGHALQRDLQENGTLVFREGRPGSGLARPDYFDWPTESRLLVETIDPDVVIIMLGGNDIQRIRDSKGEFGSGIPWEDPARWDKEYTRRLEELVAALIVPGIVDAQGPRRVYVLSPTNRRPTRNKERVSRVVELQRASLAERLGVTWVDAFSLTSASSGRFLGSGLDAHGQHASFRKPDGIHLTRAGAEDLATRLRPILFAGCPKSVSMGR